MYEAPYLMKMAQSVARHAGARQAQIATNIANADTPGFRARDVVDFSETYRQGGSAADIRTSRAGHMTGGALRTGPATYDVGGPASPNGNTVSLEAEMVRSTDAKSTHETALAVYKASLDILRTSLGKGR